MSTPNMNNEVINVLPSSRPGSLRRARRGKENVMSTNSRPSSRPTSRPSSRPSSRPASRPVSPTRSLSTSLINNDSDNDPIIPTAIVIKNIPFSVKKDALLSKLASMDVPPAYAFNYHFDNGVFRGLAFANYRTAEETEIVVNTINGLEIGGRKLRVEYKKMLPDSDDFKKKEREITSQPGSPLQLEQKVYTSPDEDTLDLNDPNVLELYSYLLLFRGDPNKTEVALPKTLSPKERRDAHLIADRLGLAHYSEGYGNDRHVIIEKRGSAPVPAPIVRLHNKNSRGNLRSSPSRDRLNNTSNNNNNNVNNSNDNKKEGYRKSMMSKSSTYDEINDMSNFVFIYQPIRQPRGPEPGKNFASLKPNTTDADALADTLANQHLTHVGA